jgi:hypothetical protein
MYRTGNIPENTQLPAEQGAFDPTHPPCYPSRKDRLDAKALEAQIAPLPDFSEDGFVRIGPGRYPNSETVIAPDVSEPTKRMNSDGRRPHRAQPTRRACNSR